MPIPEGGESCGRRYVPGTAEKERTASGGQRGWAGRRQELMFTMNHKCPFSQPDFHSAFFAVCQALSNGGSTHMPRMGFPLQSGGRGHRHTDCPMHCGTKCVCQIWAQWWHTGAHQRRTQIFLH